MMMTNPVPGGRITSRWDEPRPLSAPPAKRNHPHGALDIAAPRGTPVVAPESGKLCFYRALRPQPVPGADPALWPGGPAAYPAYHCEPFPFTNYFDDVYGTIAVLQGDQSGLIHVFAHFYFRPVFEHEPVGWTYQEQPDDSRWPLSLMHTFKIPRQVFKGSLIGRIGNAGFSTGPHLHWEIHKAIGELTPYGDRPDPETFISEV
jgi:hypothetical protein